MAPLLASLLCLLTLVALHAQDPVPADPARDLTAATTSFEHGYYAESARAFSRAAESDDAALARRGRVGWVRAALKIAEFETARREAERLHRDVPDDPEIAALSADALWASGLFDEAEARYLEAAARSPETARARFGVARSLAARGRVDEAMDQTRVALTSTPHDPDLHALAATIHERRREYADAAAAYEVYASVLPAAEDTAIATARARVLFLRSFQDRVPLQLSAADAARPHTVSFKLIRNKVVLAGRINGARVDWMLDTGAERTGISNDAAQRAGVRPVTVTLTAGVGAPRLRPVQLARAETIEIGALRVRNVPVAVRDPVRGGAPRWQGESLSPLALGLSAVVDYPRRQVTLARVLPEMHADFRLPMRMQRVPVVRGLLNARHPASFVVDTGGEVISISAETARALEMAPSRRIPLRVFGLSGPDADAFLLPGVDLDFAAIEYRKVGLAVLNLRAPSVLLGFQVGGIVGHKLLGNYRVTMDLGRGELALEK